MGAVIPFPAVRRGPFIRKQANFIASQVSAAAGEKQLATALKRQRETMQRRGIAPELIDREIRALEAAIRARLWRIVLQPEPGDAA